MQNTMVRGGEWPAQEKKLGKENEKGERKKEENYIKKGGKGHKNASFWAINKNFAGRSKAERGRLIPKI